MKYRKMGNLDWEVSALGFGCMRFPTKGRLFKRVDEDESIRILRWGIDKGINYVDTAWPYHLGKSETIVGKALQDGYREKVKLVTKLPMFVVRKEEDFDKYLSSQLKKLQVDCVDIYLFHSVNRSQFEKIKKLNLIKKMETAKEQGLIKHFGFSFHDTLPVFKEIIDYYPWEVCQIQYNYMDTGLQATTDGLTYAHEKGIAVIIMEPVKGGRLANPPQEALDLMKNSKNHRTPVDWALQFIWNRPEPAVVLSGMGNMRMVEENCASADRSGIKSLSTEDNEILEDMAAIFRKKVLVPCTACNYCMPCPYGVNIPENFALLNNFSFADGKGIGKWFKRRGLKGKYRKLASSKDELKRKPENGSAEMCTDCQTCVPKCPQSINIPQELIKVKLILGEGKSIADIF
ncbi:MAG: aldo/keto reductase [Promethearchaeota archaeon]